MAYVVTTPKYFPFAKPNWSLSPQIEGKKRGFRGLSPRPLERKEAHLTAWELTRESVEDPNAEARRSLGRIWGLL